MAYAEGLGRVRFNGVDYNVIRFNNQFIKRKYAAQDLYSFITFNIDEDYDIGENLLIVSGTGSGDLEFYINGEKKELTGRNYLATLSGIRLITKNGNNIIINNPSKYYLNSGESTLKVNGQFSLKNTVARIQNVVLLDTITSCESMFENCTGLIEAPKIPISAYNCKNMFYKCSNLITIPQENIDLMVNSNSIDSSGCYYGCTRIRCANLNSAENGLPDIITYANIPENWK